MTLNHKNETRKKQTNQQLPFLNTIHSLDDVPLTEKEEIALVLEAIVLSRPSPLATKRTLFTPGDSSLFKVRSIVAEALNRQHPKQNLLAKRLSPGHQPATSDADPPSPSSPTPPPAATVGRKKKPKKLNDDDDEDFVRKPKKKKLKIEDVASPQTSAPPTPSFNQYVCPHPHFLLLLYYIFFFLTKKKFLNGKT